MVVFGKLATDIAWRYYGPTTIGGRAMIVLFTDFGLEGPYTGQVKAVLWRLAPAVPVIDLFADAPAGRPRESAYLLAAYATWFDPGSVFLGVVDPGVGGDRPAVALKADGRWFVGPGNGLFDLVGRRAAMVEAFAIAPPSAPVAASFHGRDIFAPVAAALASGRTAAEAGLMSGLTAPPGQDWPDDLPAIVYVDRFGNAVTGLRAETLPASARLRVGGRILTNARTFSAVPPGAAFWYGNSNGLVELAVNLGRADRLLALDIGTAVEILP